ncbi:MAG: ribosome biogenesis GTPase Der [Nitrospira sp.]|nr:ribosome biogenesis GTPase Der [bacterium]MBL7050343.1 ribosome biogenesis GTPase Der [Nitrospira sp.]
MGKTVLAIIGRANVGKSTLFNRIARRRKAIIEDFPGVTRDRIFAEASWEEKNFLLVDTGGFLHEPEDGIYKEVKKQILQTIEEADALMMVLDVESGLLPLDYELIDKLRRSDKKVFYVVNKVDGPKKERALVDFYALGVELFPLSALNGTGYPELMDAIVENILEEELTDASWPKIAIVGRPNVGKSTLVNALLSKERMIVSPVAGTTRDAVDSVCTYYDKNYTIVDTAGVRKRGRMSKTVERYSFMRTVRNIEDADVVLLVVDASEGIVELDQRIAGLIHESGKGAIVIFNKWDLVDKEDVSVESITQELYNKLWFMRFVPVLTASALSKQRITKVFSMVDRVAEESAKRISTHELNEFLRRTVAKKEPAMFKKRKVKIFYITQVKTSPPGFLIFTNKKEGIKEHYIRYLENQLRESFGFEGVPVKFYLRQRK